jgi:hypothetical protein
MISAIQNTVPSSTISPATLSRQLSMLTSEQEVPKTDNPLEWWKEIENRYYVLQDLAKKYYLSVPTDAAPSERAFSLAGNICNRRRASLSPQHVDARIF